MKNILEELINLGLSDKEILSLCESSSLDLQNLNESYLGYLKTEQSLKNPEFFVSGKPFEMYRNPTRKEWSDMGRWARGWIVPSGDVYFALSIDDRTPIHFQILQVLLVKSGVPKSDAQKIAWEMCAQTQIIKDVTNILKYGVGIETATLTRVGLAESFYLTDLSPESRDAIQELLRKAHENVPYLQFCYKSVEDIY